MNTYDGDGLFVCFRLRLLNYLTNKNIYPIRSEPDFKNPKYNVWKFEKTPELMKALDEYHEIHKIR